MFPTQRGSPGLLPSLERGRFFDSSAFPDTQLLLKVLIELPQAKEEKGVKEETGVDESGEVPQKLSKPAHLVFYSFLNFIHTIKFLKLDIHKGGMDRTNIMLVL